MTDEEKAARIRECQREIAALWNELNESGYRCLCFKNENPEIYRGVSYERSYEPGGPYTFKFIKNAVVVEEKKL